MINRYNVPRIHHLINIGRHNTLNGGNRGFNIGEQEMIRMP
jgi:hypothetical protein